MKTDFLYKLASFLLALMLLPLRTTQWLIRHREWLLTVMAMVFVMLVSAAITLRIALHGREVTVPDLTGHTLSEASYSAVKSGLGLVVENRFYSTIVPAGRVLAQYPRADSVVRHGWQLRVIESLGPQLVPIPDVAGETLRDASIDIRRDSLDIGTLAHITAPGDEDMVLAQTPPPDAGLDQPRINLLLSTPAQPAASAIVLPSFVGLTSTEVLRAAGSLGLTLSALGDGPLVTSQTPAPGNRVTRGDSVRVILTGTPSPNPTQPSAPKPTTAPISLQTP